MILATMMCTNRMPSIFSFTQQLLLRKTCFFLHSISVVLFAYCVFCCEIVNEVSQMLCSQHHMHFSVSALFFSSQSTDFAIFFVHGYYFCLGSHFIGNYTELRQRKIVCKHSLAFIQREWFAEIYDEHLLRLPFDIRMSVFHQSTTIFTINCRKLITRQTGALSTLWLGFHSLWSCMPLIHILHATHSQNGRKKITRWKNTKENEVDSFQTAWVNLLHTLKCTCLDALERYIYCNFIPSNSFTLRWASFR